MNKENKENKENKNEIIGDAEKFVSKKGKSYYKGQMLFNGHRINLLVFIGKDEKKIYFVLDDKNPEL